MGRRDRINYRVTVYSSIDLVEPAIAAVLRSLSRFGERRRTARVSPAHSQRLPLGVPPSQHARPDPGRTGPSSDSPPMCSAPPRGRGGP